ncbi:MAG: hypothetical protein IKU79_02470 [Bacteroidaceae bacterium]|jgi:hypothetical protein|nr:hypothetical protein [Bacteroidaceae bacterium]
MKKILISMVMMMFAFVTNAMDVGSDEMLQTPNVLDSFSEVNVNVPARIRLVEGENYGIVISTTSSEFMQMLDYEVRNDILYISTESLEMLKSSGRGTIIYIFTPNHQTSIKLGDDVSYNNRKMN